jgi:hypothetical protein
MVLLKNKNDPAIAKKQNRVCAKEVYTCGRNFLGMETPEN